MKNKIIIASTLALSVLSGINIAYAQDGTITFTGKITDSTCGIAADSKDITVDFGTLAGSYNTVHMKPFNINLTACPESVTKANVTLTAESTSVRNKPDFDIAAYIDGNLDSQQSYWNIGDISANTTMMINKTDSALNQFDIKGGDNTLRMMAMLTVNNPGTYTGEASYTITYQ